MAFIELDRVGLTFRVRQQYQITMKEYLLRGMFRQSRNPLMEVRALQDVSLRIGDGRRVGVIGANGSGKSTLLRLMAGVYHPTAGRRAVEGKVSALFDSAGMMVRLAFSAATAIEPEILLVDEVLGAGDLAFQGKAERRLNEMMEKARILVVVSHNLSVLPRLCTEGVWLEKGRVRAEGLIEEVIDAYVEHTQGARAVAA